MSRQFKFEPDFSLIDWKYDDSDVPIYIRAYLAGYYNQGSAADFPGWESRWNAGKNEKSFFDDIEKKEKEEIEFWMMMFSYARQERDFSGANWAIENLVAFDVEIEIQGE